MTLHRHSSGRIFWGFILILLGVLFLLDQMGRTDFGDIISRWWPLILVAAGLWQLISSDFRELAGGLFLIALGAVFQLAKLEILDQSVWHYIWPALIIGLGLWVLLGAFRRSSAARLSDSRNDDLDAFAIFGGLNRRIESPSFRGGKATALMGGIELDLTGARLAEPRVGLELTAILGGIDIRVPRHMRVELQGNPILGGIENKHSYAPGTGTEQTLALKATAILGGIEIKD
jgi:predicted membrane protein